MGDSPFRHRASAFSAFFVIVQTKKPNERVNGDDLINFTGEKEKSGQKKRFGYSPRTILFGRYQLIGCCLLLLISSQIFRFLSHFFVISVEERKVFTANKEIT